MRGFVPSAVVAVGLLSMGSALAWGQQGLRGPGLGLGGFDMISMPQVQEELKLDEAQKKRAEAFQQKMAARFQADIGKLRGLSQADEMKRIPGLARQHYDEGMKGLAAFLKPQQVDRFDQILLQKRGPNAMLEPEIAKSLQLTNEQAKLVAAIIAEAINRQKEAIQAAKGNKLAADPQLQVIGKEANEKAAAVLKPEQQKTWNRITGVAFEPASEPAPR